MVTTRSLGAIRLLLVFAAGFSCCRSGLATDISTPASVNGTDTPLVILNQTGTMAYQWHMAGSDQGYYVRDQTFGTTPFVIEAEAPHDALRVYANGNVGVGSFGGDRNLHVKTTEAFPTLRLQSINDPAFCIWDLEGSAGGFNLIDVLSMNSTPFSVMTGAPTSSLLVDSTGRIGLGTSNPTSRLHVRAAAITGPEAVARFDISDDTVGVLLINNASSTSNVFIPRLQGRSGSQNAGLIMEGVISDDVGSNPVVVYNATKVTGGALATRPLVVYRNNNAAKVTIAANGAITATSFNPVSSRELKDGIADLDSCTAQQAIEQLIPVEYFYKDDPTADLHLGFIAEDVPDLVANPDRKSVPIMDVLALVTRVVKDQQQTIDELRTSRDDQARLNQMLLERLQQLEEQVKQRD